MWLSRELSDILNTAIQEYVNEGFLVVCFSDVKAANC